VSITGTDFDIGHPVLAVTISTGLANLPCDVVSDTAATCELGATGLAPGRYPIAFNVTCANTKDTGVAENDSGVTSVVVPAK
jgi:hypothetical protein